MSTIGRQRRASRAKAAFIHSLFRQVLAALLLGIVLGMAVPDFAVQPEGYPQRRLPEADFDDRGGRSCSASWCTASRAPATSRRSAGRRQGAGLFETMTTVALVVGLLLAYLVRPRPRHEHHPRRSTPTRSRATPATRRSCRAKASGSFLLNIIPTTRSTRCRANDVLQVLFLAIIFGVSLALVGGEKASASVR